MDGDAGDLSRVGDGLRLGAADVRAVAYPFVDVDLHATPTGVVKAVAPHLDPMVVQISVRTLVDVHPTDPLRSRCQVFATEVDSHADVLLEPSPEGPLAGAFCCVSRSGGSE